MSQQKGCGSGGKRLSELSFVYKVGAELVGLCGWQTGLKMGMDLEVRKPAQPLHELRTNPWTSPGFSLRFGCSYKMDDWTDAFRPTDFFRLL